MPKPSANALQAVLDRQTREPDRQVAHPSEPPSPDKPVSSRGISLTREGKKLIAGHFNPSVAKQLKLLAAEEETSVQSLLEEALDLLFVKKGRGKIVRS